MRYNNFYALCKHEIVTFGVNFDRFDRFYRVFTYTTQYSIFEVFETRIKTET